MSRSQSFVAKRPEHVRRQQLVGRVEIWKLSAKPVRESLTVVVAASATTSGQRIGLLSVEGGRSVGVVGRPAVGAVLREVVRMAGLKEKNLAGFGVFTFDWRVMDEETVAVSLTSRVQAVEMFFNVEVEVFAAGSGERLAEPMAGDFQSGQKLAGDRLRVFIV